MTVDICHSEYKILVVDDQLSNVLLLDAFLTKEHYQVIIASNGNEAIEKLKTAQPDLILLDVLMPGIDGYEVTRQIREMPSPINEIPIIFLTALSDSSEVVKGFKAGGNDFIKKPFSLEELIMRVNHQISLVEARNTILKQTKELKNIIRARDKMYSVIAHDLRSPLAYLKMMLNAIILSFTSEKIGPEYYKMLSLANKSTEEMFILLDNLLKWTKSQTGRLNVVYQSSDLAPLAKGVSQIFEKLADLKQIKIRIISPESCTFYGDKDMMKSVLRNLLSNAVKFTNPGGEIVVTVEDHVPEEEDKVRVSVRDNGCGMSLESQKNLFNIETHASTFGTNNEEGSGLGLLLCNDFVTKNGGRMWFTSKLDEGSTFFFTIPKKKQQVD